MEMMSKRHRRIYSPEPNKIMRANFARKYVNYLLPALKQIGRSTPPPPPSTSHQKVSDHKIGGHHELEKMVKREVDMAMVLSTDEEGFAWSHAMKEKLQHNEIINVSMLQNEGRHDNDDVNYTVSSSSTMQDSALSANQKKLEVDGGGGGLKRLKRTDQDLSREKNEEEEEEEKDDDDDDDDEEMRGREDEEVSRRLMNLRSVLPGGDKMDIEEMLSEVGSYIVCLELQKDTLKSLVESS